MKALDQYVLRHPGQGLLKQPQGLKSVYAGPKLTIIHDPGEQSVTAYINGNFKPRLVIPENVSYAVLEKLLELI